MAVPVPDGALPNGMRYDYLDGRQTEYQFFPEAYFSGADITIYFGDVSVDDLTGLEFTLVEKVRPVYGYASRIPNRIVHGNRIVQGSFRIAFRQAGYLFTVLDHIGRMVGTGDTRPRMARLLDESKPNIPEWVANARETIDTLLYREHDKKNDGLDAKSRYAAYEKTVWGGSKDGSMSADRRFRPYFYRDLPGEKDPSGNTKFGSRLLKTGFDIMISYGPTDTIALNKQELPKEFTFSATAKAIRGVHLMATGQVLAPNGQPIEEIYQFMAFDLD